jgi:hypothetical protein
VAFPYVTRKFVGVFAYFYKIHSAGLNIQQIGNYNDLNINMRGEYVRVDIIQRG